MDWLHPLESALDWSPERLPARQRAIPKVSRKIRVRVVRGLCAFAALLLVALLLAGTLHTAANTAAAPRAKSARVALDAELAHARTDLGIPDTLLQPIGAREQQIDASVADPAYSYAAAASAYTQLQAQLVSLEQSAPDVLRSEAQTALQGLRTLLTERRAEGFAEADTYQARLDADVAAFAQAQTPGDYARVVADATNQTQALAALWPAYEKLQALHSVLAALQQAGSPAASSAALAQSLYEQDAQVFRAADSAQSYSTLNGLIDGQVMQLAADQTLAQPYVAAALLDAFQDRINLLRAYGDAGSVATYQQQHDADAKQLAGASQLSVYLTLAQAIGAQSAAMDLPLLEAKGPRDLAVLQQLVDFADQRSVHNPADNKDYLLAYEYADPLDGVGDVAGQLAGAKTLAQYEAADAAILGMTASLRAMLDNLADPTPYNQVHQSDLELLRYYGATQGRVVIVSLREQAARFYENGQLVNATLVTTGRPGEPSLPGYHTAIAKRTPLTFTSPDPPGSPNYYSPTVVNYAVAFDNNGFWLHDAYWRSWFGPNSNLPHHDPNAFNGGSHGCVNFPESFMAWAYRWIPLYAPIIIY